MSKRTYSKSYGLITVNRDSTLSFCAKSMSNNHIRSLFLINKENKIDEIIIKTDLEFFLHIIILGIFLSVNV